MDQPAHDLAAASVNPDAQGNSRLRNLPSIGVLIEASGAAGAERKVLTEALRTVLAETRAALLRDGQAPLPDQPALLARARALIATLRRPVLRPVVNATGIILHTNLGRAPLSDAAMHAVSELARGYGNLEFDLDSGRRGARLGAVEGLICTLTGAEAALVVNNCAAATLLALTAIASGGEVIVSRGELVEIGGGFRIPDVIAQGGARLKEVGTTNRTRLSDYREAVGPDTRALLRVHPGNYRIIGFTSSVPLAELAALARAHRLPVIHDLGSGALVDPVTLGRAPEPTVQASIADGADVVAFSGDKLLGGPQAGVLAGRRELIDLMRKHPLQRALRIDKLSLAALEATLRAYLDPDEAVQRVPVLRMLAQSDAVLLARADRLARSIASAGVSDVSVVAGETFTGGGALPAAAIPTRLVSMSIPGRPAEMVARALRLSDPPIVARIAGERVVFDVLTVTDADVQTIADAIGAFLA